MIKLPASCIWVKKYDGDVIVRFKVITPRKYPYIDIVNAPLAKDVNKKHYPELPDPYPIGMGHTMTSEARKRYLDLMTSVAHSRSLMYLIMAYCGARGDLNVSPPCASFAKGNKLRPEFLLNHDPKTAPVLCNKCHQFTAQPCLDRDNNLTGNYMCSECGNKQCRGFKKVPVEYFFKDMQTQQL